MKVTFNISGREGGVTSNVVMLLLVFVRDSHGTCDVSH